MSQLEKSEQVYKILLEQTNNKRNVFERLRIAKHNLDEYQQALEFYQ